MLLCYYMLYAVFTTAWQVKYCHSYDNENKIRHCICFWVSKNACMTLVVAVDRPILTI